MAIVSPRNPTDRFKHGGVLLHPDEEGNHTLLPTNFCWNWNFADLDYDGDPEQFEIGIPEDPEGIVVYMTDKDQGFETMAAQSTTPIDIEEDSYHLNEPYFPGNAPSLQSRQAAIAPPGAPVLQTVAASKTGFSAGAYWIAYSWFDGSDSTPVSPARQVT